MRPLLKSLRYGTLTAGAAVAVTAYCATDAASSLHEAVFMPGFHMLFDPEAAHRIAIWCAEHGIVPRDRTPHDARCEARLFGRTLPSPLGLAAGFDKDARAVPGLFSMGFAAVEVGSVTPLPQPGNPQPRLFRSTPDGAVINRYGFNSQGHAAVRERLPKKTCNGNSPSASAADPGSRSIPQKMVGVNLGVNKGVGDAASAYAAGVQEFSDRADYIVINVSSPNTAGLRALQARESLSKLLSAAVAAADGRVPVVAKIAPDLSDDELSAVAEAVLESGTNGVIVSNTTLSRPESLRDNGFAREAGGLSGRPLFPISVSMVRKMYSLVGHKIPIIGSGGISTAEDAIAMARAGASFVQLYSSLSLRGPGVVPEIKRGISKYLADNNRTWVDLVGEDHRESQSSSAKSS